jgi:hypothetical protein
MAIFNSHVCLPEVEICSSQPEIAQPQASLGLLATAQFQPPHEPSSPAGEEFYHGSSRSQGSTLNDPKFSWVTVAI